MSWKIPKSWLFHGWPHFEGTKQRDRWTSPETRHLQAILLPLGAAPLACSPQSVHPHRDKQEPKGTRRGLCWVTFLSVCRTAPQTLGEPCEVSSYQLLFLWDVQAELACGAETGTWTPLVLGRVGKPWIWASALGPWQALTRAPRHSITLHTQFSFPFTGVPANKGRQRLWSMEEGKHSGLSLATGLNSLWN